MTINLLPNMDSSRYTLLSVYIINMLIIESDYIYFMVHKYYPFNKLYFECII